MRRLTWITILITIPALCYTHERSKRAIENDSRNQKSFDGYNYPTPGKPFKLPTVEQSTRPPTAVPFTTKSRPLSSSSPLSPTSSPRLPSFPEKTITPATFPQTNPTNGKNLIPNSGNGYVYTTPKQRFTFPSSTSNPINRIPTQTKTIPSPSTKSPFPSVPSRSPIPTTKQPYSPNRFTSPTPFVQVSKSTKPSTVPSEKPKFPQDGYVYTTPKTPFSITSSPSTFRNTPKLPAITTQRQLPTITTPRPLTKTPRPISPSTFISPSQVTKPSYVPSFPQSTLKPVTFPQTKPPYIPPALPTTRKPQSPRVPTQSTYTLPPKKLTTQFPKSTPKVNTPSPQTPFTNRYSPSISTKPPGYLPPKPSQTITPSIPSIQTSPSSPRYPSQPSRPTNTPFVPSFGTSPQTPRIPSQPGSRPTRPTQTNTPFVPSFGTSPQTPRIPTQPSKPTQTYTPSIQISTSSPRLPSQPGSRPPPYLPPSSPRPNYPTVTPPPYPTALYSITPSTSTSPPPTGFPAAPPTIPPSTYRPNVGYNYQIPDLPFEFRRR
ncbi:uncharacterized protein LOC127285337 [Leptopilina boulardi]|uniref:uncharacterized protein LOC127285337 n=1 Tax=Leptopilina boulardi TaxID=63433 RepID=UPI0021F52889|nr:uncharacterized protein LOC127285337 [Leptopilina boulardi]